MQKLGWVHDDSWHGQGQIETNNSLYNGEEAFPECSVSLKFFMISNHGFGPVCTFLKLSAPL